KWCPMWAEDPRVLYPRYRGPWGLARATTYILTGYVPLVAPEQIPLPAGRGYRAQSPRHLQLAVFMLQRASQNVRSRLAEWNAPYPAWAYNNESTFTSDGSMSVRRLFSIPAATEADHGPSENPNGSINVIGLVRDVMAA